MPRTLKASDRRDARRRGIAPMAEINIIPLVDVMLVLLIIVMATAAFVRDSELGLKLPQAKTGSSTQSNTRDLTVGITRAGALYVDGQLISEDALAAAMRARLASNPNVRVAIKGDSDVPYQRVIKVMDLARAAGLSSVSLGTRQPETPAPSR